MKKKTSKSASNFELLVIGASLGGIGALRVVLGNLKTEFPAPVAVVLHRGEESDDTLCNILQRNSSLPISDAEDKMPLASGCVYLAPPDYHLLVEPGQSVLSIDEPVMKSRPSIDVLFESAADVYGKKVLAVLLTGNNEDGAQGLWRIEECGGLALVQDPSTAEGHIMPEAGLKKAQGARVLPLEEIPGFLNRVCEGREKDEVGLNNDEGKERCHMKEDDFTTTRGSNLDACPSLPTSKRGCLWKR